MNSHSFSRGGVALLASFVAALVLSLTCVVPAWADPGYDSFEEARSISVNSDIRATALEDDDADWYKFTISKPGTVQLAFTHQQLTSGKWSLRITDSNAETIINYNNLPAPGTTRRRSASRQARTTSGCSPTTTTRSRARGTT